MKGRAHTARNGGTAAFLKRRLCLFLAISVPAAEAAKAAPPLCEIGTDRLARHVNELASDEYSGRKPGTPGGEKAEAYILSSFREAGLQVGDIGSGWLQPIPFSTRYSIANSASISLAQGGPLPAADMLLVGRTAREHVRGEAVYVGFGGASLDGSYRGKVVFVLAGAPTPTANYPTRPEKLAYFARRGAAAVLFVTPDDLWESERERFAAGYTTPQTSATPRIFGALKQSTIAKALKRQGIDFERAMAAATRPRFRPQGFHFSVAARVQTSVTHYISSNIVGRINGRSRPDQAIVYTAHWDHLGECRPRGEKDRICNGAIDNASGVSALIEIAREFVAGPRPDRSVYFVATTNEEVGHFGASAFIGALKRRGISILANLNLDTMALAPRGAPVATLGRGMFAEIEHVVDEATTRCQRPIDRSDRVNSFIAGQDGWAFIRQGIPAIMFGGTLGDLEHLSRYSRERYHQPNDDLSWPLELGGASEDAMLYVHVGRTLADRAFAAPSKRGKKPRRRALQPRNRGRRKYVLSRERVAQHRGRHRKARSIRAAAFSLASSLCFFLSGAAASATTAGVSQRHLADTFYKLVSAEDQLSWLREMASAANHVGSTHNWVNAQFVLKKFKEWGWDAHIETYQILYPTPISSRLEMVLPRHLVLGGQEPVLSDEGSADAKDILPPYLVYQGDGDVTADLVYVNFGTASDYEDLLRRGISVRGKIVIARYGGSWRGMKVKLAQANGAIGCLLFSDPAHDGFRLGDPYPVGGLRPEQSVERGSVLDLSWQGDPLTPGYGATAEAKRLTIPESTVLKIPALPISSSDARRLLSEMRGPPAPPHWRGALPITYHIGGGPGVKVRLAVTSHWALRPVSNVIAVLRGSTYPDQWIIRGNHRDAWVFGANDPLAGTVAMLSEARALGTLAAGGWRPKRTIVYASWDGEEPGAIGSTEWAETHAAELRKKGLVYINTDSNGRGFLFADGSPSWKRAVNQAASEVLDPETNISVRDRLRKKLLVNRFESGAPVRPADMADKDFALGALGSGSDFVAFTHHLGIPSLSLQFGGEDAGFASLHSRYDNLDHLTRLDDPGLRYGVTLAKIVGNLVLRAAQADLPPLRFSDLASEVDRYIESLETLASSQREKDNVIALLRSTDSFRAAADPMNMVGEPPSRPQTPLMDLSPLMRAASHLRNSARDYDLLHDTGSRSLTPRQLAKLNDYLGRIEQALISDEGLRGRPWYRNLLHAPDTQTGYDAEVLPAVWDAVKERRFDDVPAEVARTATAIEELASRLDQARSLLAAEPR